MKKEEIEKMIYLLEIDSNCNKNDINHRIKKEGLEGILSCTSGISKFCLVFKKEDFVLKWSRYSFDFSDVSHDNYNEVMQEYEFYQKAKNKRLEKFFPFTEYFSQVNGVDFVLQEKIDYSCFNCPEKTKEKYYKISKTATDKIFWKMDKGFRLHMGYDRDLDYLWAKMAIVLYGKKMCKNLCFFIQENKINDLHGNNLGYKNNRPIILDFSGYHR